MDASLLQSLENLLQHKNKKNLLQTSNATIKTSPSLSLSARSSPISNKRHRLNISSASLASCSSQVNNNYNLDMESVEDMLRKVCVYLLSSVYCDRKNHCTPIKPCVSEHKAKCIFIHCVYVFVNCEMDWTVHRDTSTLYRKLYTHTIRDRNQKKMKSFVLSTLYGKRACAGISSLPLLCALHMNQWTLKFHIPTDAVSDLFIVALHSSTTCTILRCKFLKISI